MCKSKGLEPVTWKDPVGRTVQTRKQPVLQEVIHHLVAQKTPETEQMPTCWLVTEQTDLQWIENINGTEDSTLLNIQTYIDSSTMDDGPLHQPEKELPIFNLSLSIPEIYDVSNLHPFPRGTELLSSTWHTGTLFILVCCYPSVSAPGDP